MSRSTIRLMVALFVYFLCSRAADAQQTEDNACVLSSVNNGQVLTVRGTIVHAPHDLTLSLPGCEEEVVLIYAGGAGDPHADSSPEVSLQRDEPVTQAEKVTLRKDREFRRFQRYVEARYASTTKDICLGCYKYEVEATFSGRMEVSEKTGFTFDESSRKIIGVDGFGHPEPFSRYRLVVHSISAVTRKKLDRLRSSAAAK